MRFFRGTTSLIGLDIGSRVVKAAQLQRCQNGWRLSTAAVLPRIADQSDDQTATRVAGVLERQGFLGHRVVLAAPVRKVECEMLDLPPRSSGAPIEQIAMAELGRTAKLEAGRFAMGCWDVPTAARGSGTSVIAVALRDEDADRLVDPLENHGLEVVAIDAPGWALCRACRPLLPAGSAAAILDLGWSAASLTVVDQQTILYQRTLWESGIEYVHKAIVAEQVLDDDAAQLVLSTDGSGHSDMARPAWVSGLIQRFAGQLCDEVLASLTFARQRFPTGISDHLLLTGGGAKLPGLQQILAEHMGMKVSVVQVGQIADVSACSAIGAELSLLTTAIGLARYGEGQP